MTKTDNGRRRNQKSADTTYKNNMYSKNESLWCSALGREPLVFEIECVDSKKSRSLSIQFSISWRNAVEDALLLTSSGTTVTGASVGRDSDIGCSKRCGVGSGLGGAALMAGSLDTVPKAMASTGRRTCC